MLPLSEIAELLDGKLAGKPVAGFTGVMDGVSTDTRSLQPGDIFIALTGPRFNGHDFVEEAAAKGAVAAIVSDPIEEALDLLVIRVPDTKIALGQLAAYHREQMNMPILAVTGSCGKTTTRAMLANVFQQQGNVLASESSFNNDIGVPLTLLRLRSTHDYAIFELGANHPGEIAYLTRLVKPAVAIITNAGPAHLAGFGDLEGVARAKGEIFEGLAGEDDHSGGIAIINNDDRYAPFWRNLVSGSQLITFGLRSSADVTATGIQFDQHGRAHFRLVLPDDEIDIQLPLLGEHNILNALATAAAAVALTVPSQAIKKGLESVIPVKGRLVMQTGYRGAVIIDDSYNANPSSLLAAIKVLASQSGESVLVLGDMLELGNNSEQFHRDVGNTASRMGISRLYAYGPLSRYTVEAFGHHAQHFENKQLLIDAIKNNLHAQTTVLVKGSFSMGMQQVAAALLTTHPAEEK